MNRIFESFQRFFYPLSPAQRTLFAGLALTVVLMLGGLFYWAFKPDYTLLFGSLPSESAEEIIEELGERNIPYRLENGGRSIYVQSSQVHELRIQLASSGLAQPDVMGYELFDENALGMTDFMQQVNKKRALEGELSRSVNSLEQVESSRVHLVLPERTPFQQTSVEATASVILNLKRGQSLSKEQVEGMMSLISGSVEGLDSGSVTVLDQNGNRLTDGLESHSDFASGSLQMQLQQQTESYLASQGQSMLDRVLGPGNSIVRVSAEHDFDRLVRESDLIDPDSRTILSEERQSEILTDESLEQVPFDEFTPLDQRGETVLTMNRDNESTSRTRNFEFNRTREVFEKTQGEVSRLSASVLLNYKETVEINENGEEVLISEPYTAGEIEEFTEVVRLALGIQPGRGDELTITQIEFHDPSADPLSFFDQPIPWNDILRWILIIASFAGIVALFYSMRNRMGEETTEVMAGFPGYEVRSVPMAGDEEGPDTGGNLDGMESFMDYKLSGQARKQLQEKENVIDEIKEFVDGSPEEAAQVMRAIMMFDKT